MSHVDPHWFKSHVDPGPRHAVYESKEHNVPYVRLGNSGLKVSKFILGTVQYGGKEAWAIHDHDECAKQMKYAYDHGINTFDTANVYNDGEAEVILGKFLKKYAIPRENVVILTKTFFPDGPMDKKGPAGFTNQRGLSRKRIFASVDESLARLQLEYIDVLYCHRFDYETDYREVMRALHDVVQSGKVRYIGMSACWAWQFQLMQTYAIEHDLTPFIAMQNSYCAMYREEEREMMPMLRHYGVGITPYSPVGGGLLCRPRNGREETPRGQKQYKGDPRGTKESELAVIDAVEDVAKARGVPMIQIAIAWALQSPFVDAPVIGCRTTEMLGDYLKGLEIKLTKEEVEKIEEPYFPVRVRGHY